MKAFNGNIASTPNSDRAGSDLYILKGNGRKAIIQRMGIGKWCVAKFYNENDIKAFWTMTYPRLSWARDIANNYITGINQ